MLTLSSMDIKNQEFKKSLRGLDESEVSAFLASVATQWQEQQDEMRRSAGRIAELESKLEHYQRIEEALQEAISTAKSSTAAAIGDAERRGQLMVEEANLTSRQITNNALQENERLKAESVRIQGKKNEIAARLRAFLTSELELLDHFDRENPAGNDQQNARPSPVAHQPREIEQSRLAPVAVPAVGMHSEMRRIDHAPAHEPTFQYDEQGGDSGFNEHDVNVDENEGETAGIAPTDSRRTDSTNNVHAMPPLPERAPQSRAHDWHPSIARANAVVATRSEAAQHPELDNSWPSDSEEVMNPNAVQTGDWDGDTTEPDAVFSAEEDSGAFNPEEPYNVSEDELEKIRRILDDLD